MPNLIIRKESFFPYTRKSYRVDNLSIDWRNPLTKGLSLCVVVSKNTGYPVNLITNKFESVGLGNLIISKKGEWQCTPGNTGNPLFSKKANHITGFSTFSRINFSGSYTYCYPLGRFNYVNESNNQGWGYYLDPGAGNSLCWCTFINNGYLNYRLIPTSSLSTGNSSYVGITDGTNRRMYINAVDNGGDTQNPSCASNTTTGVKLGQDASTRISTYCMYSWNRVISTDEISYLHKNPYDFIQYNIQRRPLIFNIISGGGQSATATPSLTSLTILVFTATATSSSTTSATATPSLASVSLLINSATQAFSSSATATPSLASVSLLINSATQAFSSSATATPSVATVSILPQTATQVYTASKTATPSLVETSIIVFTATAIFSGAGVVIALPSLASVSITSPTPQQAFSSSRIASPSLSSVSMTAYTPTVSAGAFITALPSTSFLSILLNSPTVSFYSNRTALPSVSLVSINPYDATATFGISGAVTIPYRLESLMEKQINKESRMNKYINIESTLVN